MNRIALLSLLTLTACATDPEEAVSIDQGVYGLTLSGCDVGNCDDEPYADARVTATPTSGAPLSTTSDGDGFFELALPAGTYELCVHGCTTITIGDGERARRDFVSGPGGGIWCSDGACRPGG